MSEEAVSLVDQTAYAESKVGASQLRRITDDDISAFRTCCREFIDQANMSEHTFSMARIKLDEMIFWLRAGVR